MSFVAGVFSQDVEVGIRASIGCGLFWGLIEILVSIVLFAIASYFSLSLKTYGFHKGDKVFLIDFKNEEIVSAKIQSLNYYDKNFNEMGFNVLVDDELHCVHGEDIYSDFSSAKSVLEFVTKTNNCSLSKYYPEWKDDSRFVSFYKSKLDDGLGFCRLTFFSFVPALVEPAQIDNISYFPQFPTLNLLDEYLREVKEQEKAAIAKENEEKELIDKICTYKNALLAKEEK